MSKSKVAGSITPGDDRDCEGRVVKMLIKNGSQWAIVITHGEDGHLVVASSGKDKQTMQGAASIAEIFTNFLLKQSELSSEPY